MQQPSETPEYTFSYTVDSFTTTIDDAPLLVSNDTQGIPLPAFSHASTLQVLCRYLIDVQGYSYAHAARALGRSPKTVWASYHQTTRLPNIDDGLRIPLFIFSQGLPPLEALVLYLRRQGFRNVEIATALALDARTTSTAYRRAEVRR